VAIDNCVDSVMAVPDPCVASRGITALGGGGDAIVQVRTSHFSTWSLGRAAQTAPVVTWTKPTSIVYGTPLGDRQLNASANVPGDFTYSKAAGTVLRAGTNQALTVTFKPNDSAKYLPASKTVHISVTRAPLSTTAENAIRPFGQANPPFTARFTGFVNGDTQASLRGAVQLSTRATPRSPPGGYPIIPSGPTSPDYSVMFVPGTLTVNTASTAINLNASPSDPAVNRLVTFSALVTPNPGTNVAAPTGTVTFFIDGSATAAATSAMVNGRASLSTTFGGGFHSVTAIYNGNSNFATSTSSVATAQVACTRSITGPSPSVAITGRSGTVCIRNARISGGITISGGIALDIEDSTITGAISVNGGSAVRICGNHSAKMSIAGSDGFVLVGDTGDDRCPVNTIDGGLSLTSNSHGVEAIGNHVSGPIVLVGNSGAGPFPEDTAPDVSGNGP
jgi:hypothetical protein